MLDDAGRVYLVARGPEPSCRVAAVQRLDGERGENTVVFTGRLGGERLEPGTYVLSISEEPRLTEDAPETAVRVVSKRRVEPAEDERRRNCDRAAAARSAPITLLLRREQRPPQTERSTRTKPLPASETSATAAEPALPPREEVAEEDAGVAGVQVPLPDIDGDGRADPVATLAIAAVIAALLLALATLVVRFLRGSWNP